MKLKKSPFILFVVIFIGLPLLSIGQQTRKQYIDKYKSVAIQNMRKHKVPASITLAQGLLESGNGNSELSKKSNNHFGIKCHSSWKGKRTYHDDDKKGECFRVYHTVYDSYADHADFLHKPRYAKCFELKITNYKGWAHALKDAGYATNPKYPKLLIKIIEDNQLYNFDKEALGKKSKNEPTDGEKEIKDPEIKSSPTGPNENYDKNKNFEDVDYYGKPMVKLSKNKIKYVIANKGDTPESLAKKMEMGPWQITIYNNIKKDYRFTDGQIVYLQPKRGKGSVAYHIVKNGDSIWKISQQYGVKITKIRLFNKLKRNQPLKPGQKVYLRRH
ncbi:MAG: LysM repeat protein [Salibacteraceae bacterium]|jgi:LysM repeat protein